MSVEKRIAEMERLRREATPGEWITDGDFGDEVWCAEIFVLETKSANADRDAAHIVSMQNSQEALLRIERAAAKLVDEDEADLGGDWDALEDALDEFATEVKR